MPDNIIKTTLSIGGENSYKNALKEINTSLKGLDSEMAVVNARFAENGKSMQALQAKQEILKRKYDEQQKRLKKIAEEHAKVSAKEGENSAAAQKLATEYNFALASTEKLASQIEKLGGNVKDGTAHFSSFSTAMASLGVNSESVGSALESMGNKIATISAGLATALGGTAVKSWMSLEDEIANISTIADYSKVSVSDLTDEIIDASTATGSAATDIASATYQAISAAVDTADAVDLVEKAAKAAKAGVSDVTTVIDGSTSIINGWKLEGEEATLVFDKLLKTQQLGKTTIGDLSSTIGQVAGLAPQLNVSIDEVLAAVGALTQSGYQTSSVMSGLKGVLSAILKPTSEAAEEAAQLGLDFSAAALQSKGLTGFLQDVMDKTDGSSESLAKLFGSVEGLSAVMALGGNSAESYASILDALANSSGTLDEMFSQRTSSAAQQLSIALNSLKNSAIEMGRSMAPYIQLVADKLQDFATWVQTLDASQLKNILSTTLWVAGISKAIAVVGKLIKNISLIKTAIASINTILTTTIAGPIVAATAAIAALAAGLYALHKISASSKLDLAVDTSDLDNYKIDDKTLTDPITINAEAKLQISTDVAAVGDEIVAWLSDGVPETEEEKAAMSEKINSAIDSAFASIEKNYRTRKAALDKLLAGGIIDQVAYDAEMETLNTQTDSLTADLTAKAQAVTDYISTLVASNKTITTEEITHLQELLDALTETSSAVLDATNAEQAAYEWSYKKATAGVGDEDDYQKAMEWAELQYSQKKNGYDTQVSAVHTKYASMEGDPVELAKQEAAEIAVLDQQLQQYQQDRAAAYNEILAGALSGAGLSDTDIGNYLKTLEKYNEGSMTIFGQEYGNWNNIWSALGTDDLAARMKAMNDELAKMDTSKVEFVAKTMAAQGIVDESDIKDLPSILQTTADAMETAGEQIVNGATEGVDAKSDEFKQSISTMASGGCSALETILDIGSPSKVFHRYGEYIDQGLINGLESKKSAVRAKITEIATMVERAARQALQINSPSKKFYVIGQYTAEGMIQGLNSKIDQIEAAYTRLGQVSTSSGLQRTVTKSSSQTVGGQTIYNTIQYTGAYSKREAKRFSTYLAQEQKGAAVAEGL